MSIKGVKILVSHALIVTNVESHEKKVMRLRVMKKAGCMENRECDGECKLNFPRMEFSRLTTIQQLSNLGKSLQCPACLALN